VQYVAALFLLSLHHPLSVKFTLAFALFLLDLAKYTRFGFFLAFRFGLSILSILAFQRVLYRSFFCQLVLLFILPTRVIVSSGKETHCQWDFHIMQVSCYSQHAVRATK
jgi:hypothetical protein